MKTRPFQTLRLLLEIGVTIALTEFAIMTVLLYLFPRQGGLSEGFTDTALLTLIAGPIILWRVQAAAKRSEIIEELAIQSNGNRSRIVAGIVLTLGLLATTAGVYAAATATQSHARARFDALSERLANETERRVNQSVLGLSGARGMFAAIGHISRSQFRDYVASRNLPEEFPGASGFGFIERVQTENLAAFEAREQADGAPSFRVWTFPDSQSHQDFDNHLVVRYCFPESINAKVWGLDIGSDPVRRKAAEHAIFSGTPSISGKVTLMHDGIDHTGFLYYVPIYKPGSHPTTPQERSANLSGLAFAPIILENALAGIDEFTEHLIDFEIYDGTSAYTDALLYDHDVHLRSHSNDETANILDSRTFKSSSILQVGGHTWTMTTSTTPRFDATIDRSTPVAIGVGGILASILAASIALALSTSQARAVALAESMTSDLVAAKASADQALREVAAFRGTLDTHSIISIADSRGRIIDANERFCAISGYTHQELLGQDHRILNSGQHPKSFWVDVWRTLASGHAWRGDVCNRAKDGSLYWVDSIIAPFFDHKGKIERYVSIRNDITARKRDEAHLAITLARLNSIIAGASLFAWEFCVEEDRFTFLSFEEERLGYTREQWFAPGFWDRTLHELDRERTGNECLAEIAAGRAHRLNYRMIAADGSIVHISDYVSAPEVSNGRTIVRGAALDVTDRVSAENRIEESEQRLRAIFDADPECVKLLAPDNTILEINASGLNIFEADSIEQLRAVGIESTILPEYVAGFRDLRDRVAKGESGSLIFEIRGLKGTRRWLDKHAVPMRDDSGRITAILSVTRDITVQRRAEEELRSANAQLDSARHAAEAANRAKSAFLANMSHEIRTPLTAILGFTDLLRDEGHGSLTPEQRAQTVDTIRNAGAHLLTVINDILDLSKIEAERLTIEKIETPIIAIIREVESLMRPRALGKGVALHAKLATPLPEHILSDPTRLRQILMNLVGNAVKFTDAGNITITASSAEANGQNRLILDITDTGPGMNAEQTNRLFSAFGQADETVTRKHGGSGLGLTICRRLAGLMHGEVVLLHTEPGRGSCFRVNLPLEPVAGAAMVQRFNAVESEVSQTNKSNITLDARIILAEDGVDNQRLIAFHLRKAGATVDIADNGRIALEMIEHAQADGRAYDLLLTDIQMPEMDGYTLARTLRINANPIPIIALTAHAMAEDKTRCIEAGCNEFTTKPIDRIKLLSACQHWVTRNASAA